ncbi:acyl-coenzyme A amino acid N-acyltransferase 2-like isoform X1 [Dasypus novemcinctus]|uniref:acyl-coenzyme A amino acid N-acyltransferase 2-like isoform X1 n=1 Tax=Dasypus novemcinctus TaxID=9361 RepID=UPI00265E13BF|nr:acyl-coenzyme A amino acid N-acyltransferase 2-like [Dasypus novemcinctus]XP_004483375.2 acyl-coenzyme A amino acid N-acyltransferase 2-like [Dasypus novemcinctus]XP_004483376.2 acyl-coenzyme A amino acid N-acyltransferase 2-like [Dasypus novemcinctus]XP_004483377.2 acyl-coenzyme A amino acid N-acyltransferase 2-like [Dasypus novemcinctus]XP_004483378.2 acyl-coenzyme A amino acid N-acyltransferase 2-like [Dasypus novemcinctus]
MLQLTATPASALADEPVHIRVTGLSPSQVVTVKASLKDEKGNLFLSKAFYRANEAGQVDLEQDPALGGDYVGVHPMGLFWSLKPVKAFQRLLKQDVMNSPFRVTLDLYDSVCFQDPTEDQPRVSQTVQRWFSTPGLQRVQIREGRVRGALFLPPGEGPFPGVIDLFGGIGGLVEFRASLLAAHGFAVLALAYFAYEDLPKQLLEVDLEYFEEAANLLLAHPKIQSPGIGVLSVCKGAEIGLAMACYLKQVAATICINGPNAIFEVPLRYGDLVVRPLLFDKARLQVHVSGAMSIRHCQGGPWEGLNRQSMLPVEKAQGPILFIVGDNDECLHSSVYAEQAMDQLWGHGRSSGRVLVYPGAGHLLEPPYGPLCYASWNPGLTSPLLWGGQPAAHAAAQEHAWGEIQKFFRQHLIPTRSKL